MPYNSGSIANFSSSAISDTYQRIVQTDGTYLADGTGSLINNITIPGNLVVSGTLYAQNTVVVTQSFSSGSNILGDAVDDFQTLYGTVRIPTGSLTVTGSVTSTETFVSTVKYPNNTGFATLGSAIHSVGYHANTWAGTYTGISSGFVANAYTSSATNYGLVVTRPSNPTFGQFQLFVKTDNTTVLNLSGGGPILDIANNGTSYARFDGSNFSIGATSALSKLYISGSSSQTLLRIDSPASSSILFVSGSGNVGIGTSTPAVRLHVVASAGADAIHTNGTIYFTDSSKYLYWAGGSYVGKSEHYFGSSNYEWKSFDGATVITRMNINASSGNVGVGMQAIAPSARLQVRGSGTTSATTAFRVENSSAAARLTVLDDGTSAFNTNQLFISSSGFIGIGTTTIQGGGDLISIRRDQDSATDLRILNGSNTSNARSALLAGTPGTAIGMFSYQSNHNNVRFRGKGVISVDTGVLNGIGVYTATGSIEIAAKSSTNLNQLVISDNGNVGINTPTPSASFHISGASSANLLRIDSPATSSIIYVSGSGAIGFNQTSSLTSQATFRGVLGSNYVTEINTTANGGYGVRTDGPVKASSYFFANAGGGSIQTYTGVDIMTFDSSRNVGISVSSSIGARLHIRGSGTTSGTTSLLVQNANASSSLVVLDDGDVGIGTTAPTYKLHVSSSNNNDGIAIHYPANNSTEFPFIVSSNADSAGNYVRINATIIELRRNGGASTIRTVGSSNNLTLESTSNLLFNTNGANTRMYIDTSGNVGIGTITPSASLHISGASSANLFKVDSPFTSSILSISGSGKVLINTLTGTGYGVDISGSLRSNNEINAGFYTLGGNTALNGSGNTVIIGTSGAWTAISLPKPTTVKGSGTTSATTAFRVENANASSSLIVLDNGNVYSNGPGFIASNTAFGFQSLNNPSGSATQNAAFGYQNFTANNYSGYDNVAVGYRAIQNATTGYQNMGIGTETLQNLTTGFSNTAVGHSVLRNITLNFGNTGIGLYALFTLGANQGNSNTAIGVNALQVLATGSSNIAIGSGTGAFRSGSANIFIAAGAPGIITGSGNVIIGNNQALSSSLNNTIAISDGSGNMRIYVSSSGNLGLGTTTPTAKLHVSGSPGTDSAVAIYKSGSNVLSIDGSSGRLFSVDDSLSGSLFSVNTAAGLPTIEAFSDNTVNIGKYNVYPIKVVSNGTAAVITGSFSGSIRATSITLTGSLSITGSIQVTGSSALLTLTPIDPLPTSGIPSASFATSGSGANLKPYFWNGATWIPLF